MTGQYTQRMMQLPIEQLSTVRLDRYVALKITIAGGAKASQEVNILKRLNEAADNEHAIRRPVLGLLDQFSITGPNGMHDIIVLEPMGRSLEKHIVAPQFLDPAKLDGRRLGFMREVSKQLLKAVHYLHSHSIAHRGLSAHVLSSIQAFPTFSSKIYNLAMSYSLSNTH